MSHAPGREPKVIVIGAGMSGMLMGILLKRAGISSFEILEKAAQVGGTWRDNRYPGLACDVPAYLYAYSFEPNTECSHRFARGPEIQAYFERTYAKYQLHQHIRFNTQVIAAKFEHGRWQLRLADGQELQADMVVSAAGVLHHPSTPEIPGLENFAGPRFHSARWDDAVDLCDKRVGLIGTGSTAVQIVSALAGKTRQLIQFQRTAQWVSPQFDAPYSNWSKALLRKMPWMAALFHRLYSGLLQLTYGRIPVPKSWIHAFVGYNCRRALQSVRDPVLREKLTPNYQPGCKRLILSDLYYGAIQHPTCQLVTEGIERIEPNGIRTRDGVLHELDVLVTATGFKAHHYMRPMQVTGADGLELDDAWAQGERAYRGVAIPGFPNFFMMMGPHSPIGNFSLVAIAEAQGAYIMQFVEMFRQGKLASAAPRVDATQRFNETMADALEGTVWLSGCQSW